MSDKAKPSTRRVVVSVVLSGVLICIGPSLIKAAYEMAGAGAIRAAVGKTVEFRHHDGQRFRGILEYAKYRPNDKWGFLDYQIRIVGDGGIETGLGPSELDDIEIRTIWVSYGYRLNPPHCPDPASLLAGLQPKVAGLTLDFPSEMPWTKGRL